MRFLKNIKNGISKLKDKSNEKTDGNLIEKILEIFNAKTINHRILRLVLISSIGIAALITISSVLIINNSVRTSVNSEISTMTNTYSKYITFVVDTLKESLETVGRMSEITDSSMTAEQRSEYLKSLCEEMTFDSITVAGITGKTYEGSSVFNEEYFSSARMGQTYLTSPVYNEKAGKAQNIIAAQVTNGNAAGVVIATISSDYFSKLIAGYKESTLYDGYCFIVDSQGRVIAHHDAELVSSYARDGAVEQNADFTKLLEKMVAAEGHAVSKAKLNDGKTYYTAYTPIEGYEEWSIAAVIPASKVNQEIISKLAVVILLALLLIIGVIIISIVVAKSISKPIIELTDRVVNLSSGDLKSEVPVVNTRDETMDLYNAMNSTVDKLNTYISEIDIVLSAIADKNLCVSAKEEYLGDFVGIKTALTKITDELGKVMVKIKNSSEQVAYSAHEMSDSAMNLATGANEQNQALERVINGILDVAHHANANVSIAEGTEKCVRQMSENVQESFAAMEDMLSAMRGIAKSSNEIEKIISIIEDITFQTNILSLNASIEAAKAGKYGMGFSVVAEEIRTLSDNCSEVLEQIKVLIDESVSGTENGVRLAGNVSDKLNVLVDNVAKTTDAVVEIANSSEKQAEAVELVKNGLDKIDGVVQSNSATAEQTAALAEELKIQSKGLMDLVTEFKIDSDKE